MFIPDTQSYKTNSRLSSVLFENDDILKLARSLLNIQKAHGLDDTSICMIKMCDSALVKPLSLTLQNSLYCSTFPGVWHSSNIYLIPKKKLQTNC